jgi:hypothetical protein
MRRRGDIDVWPNDTFGSHTIPPRGSESANSGHKNLKADKSVFRCGLDQEESC